MRRLALTLAAGFALLAPASALAATEPVTLSDTGFDRHEIVIRPGDGVQFMNASVGHWVAFEDESGLARCVVNGTPDCTRNFPDPGQFRFFDGFACASYDTCTDPYRGIVIVDGPPVVTTLNGPASGTRGQEVTFTGAAADPNGDSITSYNWDFGDGVATSTTTGEVQHAYATAGTFTVTLTTTDSRGNFSAPTQIALDVAVPDRDGDGVNDDADACPDVAAATSNGCPIAAILVPPRISTHAVAASALGQAGVVKSGVTVAIACSDSCTAVFTLLRTQALGMGTVGTKTAAISGQGSEIVRIPIALSAKRSLARARNPKLRLQVVVTDAQSRVQTLAASISLKPVRRIGRLPAIGISDQQPGTFTDLHFRILRLKYARLVSPWNGIFTEPARLDAWLQAARAARVRPLVSFEHARGEPCPKKPCRAPSAGQYRRAWKAFHKKYPWVRDISPWNEVNSATQPTGTKPQLAALYYNVVRTSCRGCRIVAADLLDTNNLRRYIAAFLARARGKPRLWGLHNYRDTNRFRETGTRTLLGLVKGQVWFTETGGIVRFKTQSGQVALPKSEKRAKKAMDFMFRLAEKYSSRVRRIYVYQWRVNNLLDRFDAGVVRPDGKPRGSFDVLSLNASIARKR